MYSTCFLPIDSMGRSSSFHAGLGYGSPTLRQGKLTSRFHEVTKRRLNDIILAGTIEARLRKFRIK